MPAPHIDPQAIADQVLLASDAGGRLPPITARHPGFSLPEAYDVAARVIRRRIERGERPLGWKIGFTNRTIWDEYGVHAPIWGPMYDSTLLHAHPGVPVEIDLQGLAEPRIEPEIAFRMAAAPRPEMDERALLACVDAVAHGVEIVQSLFPGWRFEASDTVAAFALHGRYRCGPLVAISADARDDWFENLSRFAIELSRDGELVDRGSARDVLDGPLSALRHFVRGLAEQRLPRGIEPGDIITTGTVTRAFPVAAGERWSTEVVGLPLPGLDIRFA